MCQPALAELCLSTGKRQIHISDMNDRPTTLFPLLAFMLLLPGALPVHAWTGALPQGGELRVDPDTRRAWRVEGDTARPMWDGVHRLEDGSVVIIRDGTAVPSEQMLNAWESRPERVDELEGRPCEQLERRVCGPGDECRASAGCLNARRLLNLEREAQRRAPFDAGARPETEVADQCRAALADPAFPACSKGVDAAIVTHCQTLVERVCGADGHCSKSPACPPARQLLDQEDRERTGASPGAVTPSGAQCRDALGNAFFAPCD